MKIPDQFLVKVSDYHQYGYLVDFIKELTDKNYKYYELTNKETDELQTYVYTGLIYCGKRPTWDKIKKLKVINFDA